MGTKAIQSNEIIFLNALRNIFDFCKKSREPTFENGCSTCQMPSPTRCSTILVGLNPHQRQLNLKLNRIQS